MTLTSALPDVSRTPLDQIGREDTAAESWIEKAVRRIREEAGGDPAAAVAAFQSSL